MRSSAHVHHIVVGTRELPRADHTQPLIVVGNYALFKIARKKLHQLGRFYHVQELFRACEGFASAKKGAVCTFAYPAFQRI